MNQKNQKHLAAVNQDGYALQHVPNKLRTPEICMAAVNQDGYALQYVPNELRTPEICMAAVAKSKDAIKFINDEQLKQTLMALYNID